MKRKSKGAPHTLDYFFERSIPEPNSGCWIWLHAKNNAGEGYGMASINGTMKGAHRAAYECAHGVTLGREEYVCHRCDVSMCVNPSHLFIGTQAENMADCAKKGRNKWPVQYGADCHKAKLTEADVLEILKLNGSLSEVAKSFGVTKHAIYGIRNGKTWKHVTRDAA